MMIKWTFNDASEPWGLFFQDNATFQMEELEELHNNIMFYLAIILFAVSWMILSVIIHYYTNNKPIKNITRNSNNISDDNRSIFISICLIKLILLALAFLVYISIYIIPEIFYSWDDLASLEFKTPLEFFSENNLGPLSIVDPTEEEAIEITDAFLDPNLDTSATDGMVYFPVDPNNPNGEWAWMPEESVRPQIPHSNGPSQEEASIKTEESKGSIKDPNTTSEEKK